MAATWPSTLPVDPLLNSLVEADGAGVIRSQVDAGTPRMRNRYVPTGQGAMHVQMILTDRQARTLRNFYNVTLARVGAFTFEDMISDESRECRFASAPSMVLLSGGSPANLTDPEDDPPDGQQRLFEVRFTLEMLN